MGRKIFVAVEEIAKDDELTYDYGIAQTNPRFRMVCKCRSRICRGIITGDDWKKENLKTEKGPQNAPSIASPYSLDVMTQRWRFCTPSVELKIQPLDLNCTEDQLNFSSPHATNVAES